MPTNEKLIQRQRMEIGRQEAHIDAALAKVEGVCHCEEWLKPPCLPCEIRKALKGGSDAE